MTGMLDRPITCPNTRMIGRAPRHPIRGLRADDVDRVRRFYRGLSADSVYNRFFTGGQPGEAELRRLFNADSGARDVLVALSGEDAIGLVEGATSMDLPGAVEIGLVVADAWQALAGCPTATGRLALHMAGADRPRAARTRPRHLSATSSYVGAWL
jgi:hypothetical protein